MHCRALRQASRVIVLGDDMRDRIVKKGTPPNNVAVVRDGTALPAATVDRNDPMTRAAIEEIRCGFPFVVVHAGNLGFYGAWQTLLKAAEILRNDGIGLVFIGDGANRKELEAAASAVPNVRFLPFRPASEIPCTMAAADVHIVTIRRGLEGVVVPSKLYSILAAGRPILAVAPDESDAARIAVDSGCGLAADPDDPGGVAQAIRQLRSDRARLAVMSSRAVETARKYSRVNELQRFCAVLEDAVNDNNGRVPH
jgi:glycosyltransferase involved in cell wall biosynthesis